MPESGIATRSSVAGLDVTLSGGVLSVTIDMLVLLRSHDFIEGATAFQQRRTPNFTDR
jgi:hypothetical protein